MSEQSATSPTEVLAALDFVEWDRGTVAENIVTFFGWVRRSDGQRDFIYLEFSRETLLPTWWATSSAKYSRALNEALAPSEPHSDCVFWRDALRALELSRPVEAT